MQSVVVEAPTDGFVRKVDGAKELVTTIVTEPTSFGIGALVMFAITGKPLRPKGTGSR